MRVSENYTKLSSTLVHSTVWRESAETRVVWITLLALADQHGEVLASIPGLADASRVTISQCEAALAIFLAPDIYSRTKTLEGRRLLAIPGGWSVVNHDLYRGLLSLDHRRALNRDRQERHRAKNRNAVTRDITQNNAPSRQADEDAEGSTQYAVSKGKGKLRTAEAEEAASIDSVGRRLPIECKTALAELTALSKNAPAWLAELGAMLDGMHGPAVPPDVLGLALRDMQLAGALPNGRTLRGFVRKAAIVATDATNGDPNLVRLELPTESVRA